MNPRERSLALLQEEPVDRIPVVHFGYWKETLQKWSREGHITEKEASDYKDGNAIDSVICSRLGFDHCWTAAFWPNPYLLPAFESEIIKELPDGSRHVLNHEGVIELDVPGAISIRAEIEHLLVDRESWEKHYKWRLQWASERVSHVGQPDPNSNPGPRGIWCGSLIGNIRNILGVEGLAYMNADDPELLDEIIDTFGALSLRTVEETLARVEGVDFAHFWEDICYNHGPLVNPRFFAGKIVPWYRKITSALARSGIDLVSVDCDGCIDTLIPHWLDAGVNIMFPIEVGTWNASIAPWRQQYGNRLKGVGGVRKQVFAQDKSAIDKEIERLKPLIQLGGYIPCPDHRIPPESKWDLVRYYTDQLARLEL